MAFGRNPHVAKAEAAEQKALDAKDPAHAWREAARLWDRAASREPSEKRRAEYAAKAQRARAAADGELADALELDAPLPPEPEPETRESSESLN